MTEKPTEDQMVRVLAERGMGWQIRVTRPTEFSVYPYYEFRPRFGDLVIWASWGAHAKTWNPFTSISDAFMLIDALMQKGYTYRMTGSGKTGIAFACRITIPNPLPGHHVVETADTPCRAIALAAFAALEGAS